MESAAGADHDDEDSVENGAMHRTDDVTPEPDDFALCPVPEDSVTTVSPLHGDPYGQEVVVQEKFSNVSIDGSSFPNANVGSKIKSKTKIYDHRTIIYTCPHAEDTTDIYHPGRDQIGEMLNQKVTVDSKSKESDVDPEYSPSSPPFSLGAGQFYPGGTSTCRSLSGDRPTLQSQDENVTQVSDKILFYNSEVLRKGSRVYKGQQKHAFDHWREVAVKLVMYNKRNMREIKILLDLAEHPNIVSIIESDKLNGREIYIVMELCSKNLAEVIAEKDPMSFHRKATYTKQMFNGLQFIHSNKIIHGDMKLDNVLFSWDMRRVKISDFGLSKIIPEGNVFPSDTSSIHGSDGFKAPELYLPSPKISYASDMFSTALVVFCFFTMGHHPFGADRNDWSYHIRKDINRDMTQLENCGIPSPQDEFLLEILDQMLDRDPSSRPTATEVLCHRFFEGIFNEICEAPAMHRYSSNTQIWLPNQTSREDSIATFSINDVPVEVFCNKRISTVPSGYVSEPEIRARQSNLASFFNSLRKPIMKPQSRKQSVTKSNGRLRKMKKRFLRLFKRKKKKPHTEEVKDIVYFSGNVEGVTEKLI